VSYKSHRIPPQIIARAVWLYFRFPLGLRLVEEKLFERRIVLSYEIRRSATKFGLDCSRRLARLDALLRGGQDLAEPIFGTCLRRDVSRSKPALLRDAGAATRGRERLARRQASSAAR
jgi:hypothetical protein